MQFLDISIPFAAYFKLIFSDIILMFNLNCFNDSLRNQTTSDEKKAYIRSWGESE